MKVCYMSLVLGLLATCAYAADKTTKSSDQSPSSSSYTRQAIQETQRGLNFNDRDDFEAASKGFIATWPDREIKTSGMPYVVDSLKLALDTPAPATVNPSLWRQAGLNSYNGLFKVTDKVYQIRGFDISNMTLIEGKSGWIVIDPLSSVETAAAGLKLANEKLGQKPEIGRAHV